MRPPELRISQDELIVDNFAGGGGASLGIEWALGRSPDIAINHDPEAIAMHKANHPATRHYCEDVWKVDPAEACGGRPVGLAWFSPDCKHFSKAKGGKPVDKKIRGLAWIVYRWAKAVRPRVIMLENVEEFADWGPLLEDGMPCPLRKGFTFRRWWKCIENQGYRGEMAELVAKDYGAPTTRRRLFIIFRRDGQPIVWPDPTDDFRVEGRHVAADCIDFWRPTYSIFLTKEEGKHFGVKRPLVDNTMRRVFRGYDKFVVNDPQPYLVPVMHGPEARVWGLDEPFRTLTGANRGDRALVMPYLTEHANASNPRSFPVKEPLRTQCAQVKGGHFALVAPYMVPRYGERPGQEPRTMSVQGLMPTIVPTQNGAGLVAAFLAKHYGGHETPGSRLSAPINAITSKDHNALVASSLVKLKGTCAHGQQLQLPLATVQAGGLHYAETRALLVKYYGGNDAVSVKEPMRTATTLDRFGLVTVHGERYVCADLGMRMLVARELYRAQGFPDTYNIGKTFAEWLLEGHKISIDEARADRLFLTAKAQVRMVGNSVCPPVAAAIVRAQFEQRALVVQEVA